MEYGKYSKIFAVIALCTFIFYLLVTNDKFLKFKSLTIKNFSFNSYGLTHSFQNKSIKINATNESILASSPKTNESENPVSDYYPRLSIHVFTENVSAIGNSSKLILLGNSFFGERDWGIGMPSKSSTQKMTSLLCPFLSDRCDITADPSRFSEADAIVYHIRDHIDKNRVEEKRRPNQRIVFALWESPSHTPDLQSFENFFNWTMTYRFDSHIVASYYTGNAYVHKSSPFYELMVRENATRNLNLTVITRDHRPSDEILAKKKLGTAAALISNCGGSSNRLEFVRSLQRYIDVKVYGRCGETCPSNKNCRQFIAENYYFILSFENSLCKDYTTEKFFAALEYPVVPVVLGRTNYSYFIPPSGFIDTNQFSNMSSLGQYLNETRYNKEKYLSYFAWKKDYVWNLYTFFSPFCDLCLRLHFDPKPNVIDDIHKWWFDGTCQRPRVLP